MLWLVEVKDYSGRQRQRDIELSDEVALKVRDSLAILLAARANAQSSERDFAGRACHCQHIRLVLHLEQPTPPSRLFPQVYDPAKLLQKLRQLLKAIDPRVLVVDMSRLSKWPSMLPWTVANSE